MMMASNTGACSPSAGTNRHPARVFNKRKLCGPGSPPISKSVRIAASTTAAVRQKAFLATTMMMESSPSIVPDQSLATTFEPFSLTGQPQWIFSSTELDLQGDCIRGGKAAPWADLPPHHYRCLLAHVVASLWRNSHLKRHRNESCPQTRAFKSTIDEGGTTDRDNHDDGGGGGGGGGGDDDDYDDDDDRIAAALDLLYLHLCHCGSSVTTTESAVHGSPERRGLECKRKKQTGSSKSESKSTRLPAQIVFWLVDCNVLVPLLALRRSDNRDVAEAADSCLGTIIAIVALFAPSCHTGQRQTYDSYKPHGEANSASNILHKEGQPEVPKVEKETTTQTRNETSVHGGLDGTTYVWSLVQEVQRRQPDAFNVLFHATSCVHPKGVAVVDVHFKHEQQHHASSETPESAPTVLRRMFFEPSGLWEHGFAESDILFALPLCQTVHGVCDGLAAQDRTLALPLCQPTPMHLPLGHRVLLRSLCGYRKTIINALFRATRASATCENERVLASQPKNSYTSKNRNHRYLVLGFGGGLISRTIVEEGGGTVDCVEIDEQVIRASRCFHSRAQVTGEKMSPVTVHHADALAFCRRAAELAASCQGGPTGRRHDSCFAGIVVDLLSEGSLAECVQKPELWSAIEALLCSDCEGGGGVVAVNAGHQSHEQTRSLGRLLGDHFSLVNAERVNDTDSSIVFIAKYPKAQKRSKPAVKCVQPSPASA